MAHSIEKIKSVMKGGGARPNLFQVNLTSFPGGADYDSDEFSVLCKAAQLPASNIASIDVPFRGRIFKVAGDRTFDTWTVTVINDNDFKIRTAMEAWMQFVGQYADGSGATNPADYQVDAEVLQFARSATALSAKDGKDWKIQSSISSTEFSQPTSAQLTFHMILVTPLKNSL